VRKILRLTGCFGRRWKKDWMKYMKHKSMEGVTRRMLIPIKGLSTEFSADYFARRTNE
jgi:hypothetical protein